MLIVLLLEVEEEEEKKRRVKREESVGVWEWNEKERERKRSEWRNKGKGSQGHFVLYPFYFTLHCRPKAKGKSDRSLLGMGDGKKHEILPKCIM